MDRLRPMEDIMHLVSCQIQLECQLCMAELWLVIQQLGNHTYDSVYPI